MSAKVIPFTGPTILPDDPNVILEKAKGWNFSQVVVLGWAADGEFVFGGSHCEIAGLILLLEIAKKRLVAEADG